MTNWRNTLLWADVPVQPDVPSVVHHTSMKNDEIHHTDDDGEPIELINGTFTRDWSKVTCDDCKYGRIENALFKAHEREAERRNAEFYNEGWASGDDFIHSKTSRGKLYSEIDPQTLRVRHSWDDYD